MTDYGNNSTTLVDVMTPEYCVGALLSGKATATEQQAAGRHLSKFIDGATTAPAMPEKVGVPELLHDCLNFIAMWAYPGELQTFESRERFRAEAALLIAAPTASGAEVSSVQDETGWLIEAQGPVYLGPQNDGILGWTGDTGCAIRFSRELDAQRYIDLEGLTGAQAVEHMWCGAAVAEQGDR